MKPESTADLIAALNSSAAIHDYGQKDDTKTNPPPDSIPRTLAGELDTEEAEASEEPADETPENDAEASQKDNEPSDKEGDQEKEREQQAKDAARWHDYARAFASNCAFKPNELANCAALAADAMIEAFKSRFPNA